jgi:hypothetical protein
MRTTVTLALLTLNCLAAATAQVTSSGNMRCTVVAGGGMSCNGIGGKEGKDRKIPKLFITHFILEPGATLDEPGSPSDCLIIGISGGDLVNEKPPFLHVSLANEAVALMPRGVPYLLRNTGAKNVELRLIEIRR